MPKRTLSKVLPDVFYRGTYYIKKEQCPHTPTTLASIMKNDKKLPNPHFCNFLIFNYPVSMNALHNSVKVWMFEVHPKLFFEAFFEASPKAFHETLFGVCPKLFRIPLRHFWEHYSSYSSKYSLRHSPKYSQKHSRHSFKNFARYPFPIPRYSIPLAGSERKTSGELCLLHILKLTK